MKINRLLIPLLSSLAIAGSVVPLCSCAKDYKAQYSLLVQNSVDKLVELNKHPRCTSQGIKIYLDGARGYLTQQVVALGLSQSDVCTDDYGNLWFDVPATAGCESYEPLILQGHMDMVVAGIEKDKKHTTPIETYVDWQKGIVHSKDYKTSLGADNGVGLTTVLSLLSDKTIAHGPIRVLATADEDSGMLGAQAIYNEKDTKPILSKMGKDFQGKDIKYLLNLDNESSGSILKSCAGSITYAYESQLNPSNEAELSNHYYLDINGLKGGHSGVDIPNGRANAEKCLYEILNKITTNSGNVQIIKNYHPKDGKDISFSRNQIVSHARVVFNTDIDKQVISGYIKTLLSSWQLTYSGEDWNQVNITINDNNEIDHTKYLSKQESQNIISKGGTNIAPGSDKMINQFDMVINQVVKLLMIIQLMLHH